MNKVATVLLLVNFITVLFPQPGYIHPDEFFQSTEIVAGDILDVSHVRAWEFNSTFPIRSIVFPYIVTSPSLYLLRWANSTSYSGLSISAVKVVMATRLPIAFLSVFGYLATGRLAVAFSTDKYMSTVLYCSSYVSWTYYTRNFSNSVESVLLAIVLLLVAPHLGKVVSVSTPNKCKSKQRDVPEQEENDKQDNKPHEDEDKIKETDEKDEKQQNVTQETELDSQFGEKSSAADEDKGKGKAKPQETTKQSQETKKSTTDCQQESPSLTVTGDSHVEITSFALGVVITAAVFNRPTFLVFAFIPTVWWLWGRMRAQDRQGWSITAALGHLFLMNIGAAGTFMTFVILDTLYYNPEFKSTIATALTNIADDQFSFQSIQASLETLKSSLVITPWNFVLYNTDVSNLAQHGLHPRYTHFLVNLPLLLGPLFIPFIIVCFMSLASILINLNKTSVFSNSLWLTAMALVPVLSLSVFPHQEPRFLIPILPVLMVMGAKVLTAMAPAKLSFFAMWTIFNILLTLVYGYMHQAALIPALSVYQLKLTSSFSKSPAKAGVYHAIFYKTYTPPRHLLLLDPANPHVFIHDLAGSSTEKLVRTVQRVKGTECRQAKSRCHIHVFLPSTVTPRVLDLLPEYKIDTTSICPHLSMEAPPRFSSWWKNRVSFEEFIMDFCLNILKIT